VDYPTSFGRRIYQYSIQSTVDERGEVGALVTVHDRTPLDGVDGERNLAELESIYSHAPVGLAVLDAQLRFVRVNERLAEMNGFLVEEHLVRMVWELVPDLQEAAEPMFRRVLDTGEGIFDVELVGETAASPGVRRTWIEHYVPLKNASGAVIGINAVVQEVTEQRKAEQELRRAKRQLEVTLTVPPSSSRCPQRSQGEQRRTPRWAAS
jgi:PAS domain S-box-containing protein